MADELSASELGQVLAALDRIGDELSQIGTWLATQDHDQASMLLQDAWHSVATGGWVLERPLRDAQRQQAAGRSTTAGATFNDASGRPTPGGR
jgi:hypothetical protein